MAKLKKRSLFRVVYRRATNATSGFYIGGRKTVVADELQEAIDRVRAHEDVEVEIIEVVREGIEVWS